VQGTPEERERVDFTFSEQRIAEELGIIYKWDSDPCVFGVAQVLNDLVDLGYCKGVGNFNGHRWMNVSPSADSPDMLPSASLIRPPLPKLPLLRRRALQFIHEQTVRHEEGITFYTQEISVPEQEALSVLLPTTNEMEAYSARDTLIQAMSKLKKDGFVAGVITGSLSLWVTFKGACWLLIMQPLLRLSERATRLAKKPEALEAVEYLIEAYGETHNQGAPILYMAIEKLENAVGGERRLAELLSQPRPYIGDLKQSLQFHRHAATNAQLRLNPQQCLERTTKIIEMYIALSEYPSS
jgi:hypothetical protein